MDGRKYNASDQGNGWRGGIRTCCKITSDMNENNLKLYEKLLIFVRLYQAYSIGGPWTTCGPEPTSEWPGQGLVLRSGIKQPESNVIKTVIIVRSNVIGSYRYFF